MAASVIEFKEWTPEVQQRLFDMIGSTKITQFSEKAVSSMFFGAFDTKTQRLEETLLLLSLWVLQAKRCCQRMIEIPDFGYKDLTFVAQSDDKEFDLMPMLEGETDRFTLAAAVIVHPQGDDYILCSTNEQGWQDWLNEETRLLNLPVEAFVKEDETSSLTFLETENYRGGTYYTSK